MMREDSSMGVMEHEIWLDADGDRVYAALTTPEVTLGVDDLVAGFPKTPRPRASSTSVSPVVGNPAYTRPGAGR
jgi:hypothetical protein